jgi:GNAT superfamily N-acetyltransferase
MQRLASRIWPHGPHAGGLGWEAASDQLPGRLVLADDGDGVAGWAGSTDGELTLQADPDRPEAARLLIEWAIKATAAVQLTVTVFDGDEAVGAAVTAAGFARLPGAEPVAGMFRAASPAGPARPAGYRIRGVRAGELDARVEAHRAAWRPATLPWPADVLPTVSPEATSRFTMSHYEQVRRTWLYDQDLDLVVEAPDGTLAACCIAWWDPAAGCAEIEPLGVVPDHRRRGLATAMCWEVAARVAALGGNQVFINTSPRPDYPAPAQTYLAAGFEVVSRGHLYRRQAR